jgi:hypothetical protein
MAVDAALDVLDRFASSGEGVPAHSTVAQVGDEVLAAWRRAVSADLEMKPLDAEEWARLRQGNGEARGRPALRDVPDATLAYGTTLLAALLAEQYMLIVQIGDGDVLVVDDDGAVSRPLPADPRLFAGETTSLCSRNARRHIRTALRRFSDLDLPPPALVMVSTDGYANSFREDAGFVQVGSDLLDAIRAEGAGAVAEALPSWLEEASRLGSGDDVTVGVICRDDPAGGPPAQPIDARSQMHAPHLRSASGSTTAWRGRETAEGGTPPESRAAMPATDAVPPPSEKSGQGEIAARADLPSSAGDGTPPGDSTAA